VPLSSAADRGLADAVVVLAGTGAHRPGSGLAAVPAVRRTLTDLKRVLVSRCQVSPDNVTIVDPADPAALGDALEDAVQRAAGPLVFYFVGHGLVSEDGRLHLATRRTVVGRDYTALAYDTVRRRMRDSRSPLRIVILDCCFAGRAIDVLSPAGDVGVAADIEGVSVLTSAGREELAIARPDAAHTVFSGALLELLTQGDPGGPEFVTLDGAVRYVRGAMRDSGYPVPRYARTGRAGEVTITTNPGWRPGGALPVPPVPPEPPAAARAGRWQVAVGLAGVLAMVLAMLTSAGREGPDTTPLVIMARAGDVDTKLIRLWNAGHRKKVRVQALTGGPEDAHKQLIRHARSRTGAVDVYQIDVTETAEFAVGGYIVALPGPAPDTGGFLQNALQTCRYGDRLWALPFTTDAGLLYYRTDLVRDVPASLGEITAETTRVRATPAARRPGLQAGFAGQLGAGESRTVNALEAVWAAGGDVVTAGNRVDLQSPAARAGLRWLARGMRGPAMPVVLPSSLSADEGGTTRAFVTGRTLFMRNWSVPYRAVHSGSAVTSGVAALPGPGVLGGQNLAVASTSTQPLAARELIDFLTSPEVADLTFARESGAPARAEVYRAAETRSTYPYADLLRESVDRARLRPVTPHYRRFSQVFGDIVADAIDQDGRVTDAQVSSLEAALRGE
jgi:multiple sugar transport system substrate-binding protein